MNRSVFFFLKKFSESVISNKPFFDFKHSSRLTFFLDFILKEGLIHHYIYFYNNRGILHVRVFYNSNILMHKQSELYSAHDPVYADFLSLNTSSSFRLYKSSPFKKIVLYSELNRPFYISLKRLSSMLNLSKIFVLSTPFGYLSGNDCVTLGIGGLLICSFIF